MLTHGNFIAGATGTYLVRFVKQTTEDVMVSFLPMAHIYERLMQVKYRLQLQIIFLQLVYTIVVRRLYL